MLGIKCIKLRSGYLYFSLNTFPKIQQKLGGQLEICVSVYTYPKGRALVKMYRVVPLRKEGIEHVDVQNNYICIYMYHIVNLTNNLKIICANGHTKYYTMSYYINTSFIV